MGGKPAKEEVIIQQQQQQQQENNCERGQLSHEVIAWCLVIIIIFGLLYLLSRLIRREVKARMASRVAMV